MKYGKYVLKSFNSHPVVVLSVMSGQLFSYALTVYVTWTKLSDKDKNIFIPVFACLLITLVVIVINITIFPKFTEYLFFKDYTNKVSNYLENTSRHDAIHMFQIQKTLDKLTGETNKNKICKTYSSLIKHYLQDVFMDLESVVNTVLYQDAEITLELLTSEISQINVSNIETISYFDSFVEEARTDKRDKQEKPLTEEMKTLIFTTNLTKQYILDLDKRFLIIILTDKLLSENKPEIYGFLTIKWKKEFDRPFIDEEYLKSYLLSSGLAEIHSMCYYLNTVQSELNLSLGLVDLDLGINGNVVRNYDLLKIIFKLFNNEEVDLDGI